MTNTVFGFVKVFRLYLQNLVFLLLMKLTRYIISNFFILLFTTKTNKKTLKKINTILRFDVEHEPSFIDFVTCLWDDC